MDWTEWLLLTVAGIIITLGAWVGRSMACLSSDYVPRPQVDARFKSLETRIDRDLNAQDQRTDKRFDTVDAKLDRILERMDGKADK